MSYVILNIWHKQIVSLNKVVTFKTRLFCSGAFFRGGVHLFCGAFRGDGGDLRVHVFHDAPCDLRRGVPWTSVPSCHDDPRGGPCDGVHPSCGVPPCDRDGHGGVRVSRGVHPCDSHRKTCVPCGTRPYELCDDSHWSCVLFCDPSSRQTFRPCGLSRARGVLRASRARRGGAYGDLRVPRGDPRGASCRARRGLLCRGGDGGGGPYDPSHRAPRDDGGDAPCPRVPRNGDRGARRRPLGHPVDCYALPGHNLGRN